MPETLKPGPEHADWKAPTTGTETQGNAESEQQERQQLTAELAKVTNSISTHQLEVKGKVDWDQKFSNQTLSRILSAAEAAVDGKLGNVEQARVAVEFSKQILKKLTEPTDQMKAAAADLVDKIQRGRSSNEDGQKFLDTQKALLAENTDVFLADYLGQRMKESGVDPMNVNTIIMNAAKNRTQKADYVLSQWSELRQQTHPGESMPHEELLPDITTLK